MFKRDRRTNDDKFYKLETKRYKKSKKRKDVIIDDSEPICNFKTSASELVEYYEDLE